MLFHAASSRKMKKPWRLAVLAYFAFFFANPKSSYAVIYDTLNQSPTGLRTIGMAVGALLVLSHGLALVQGGRTRAWLKQLPFNAIFGRVVMVIAAIWAFFLFKGVNLGFIEIPRMDMGEFFHLRPILMILVPITAFLVITFCEEFLSARALGCLMLLVAAVPLDAAFLHEPQSRLLLAALAYVWITVGLFWIGMPYLLRDQVNWATASTKRWGVLCVAGIAYGTAILACALMWW